MSKSKLLYHGLALISTGILLFSQSIPALAESTKELTSNELENNSPHKCHVKGTTPGKPELQNEEASTEEVSSQSDEQMDDPETTTTSSENPEAENESESSASSEPEEKPTVKEKSHQPQKDNEIKVQKQQRAQLVKPEGSDTQAPVVENYQSETGFEAPIAEESPSTNILRDLDTAEFILLIGEQARTIAQKQDLYASVMIAQAILESGSGSSVLATAPNFNLFGIKGSCLGRSISLNTQEDDGTGNLYTIQASFKKYASYQESLEDYAQLMHTGLTSDKEYYSGVWKSKAPIYEEATSFLQGRYATDIHYAQKLDQLIRTYDLTQYDHPFKLSHDENQKTQAVRNEALKYLGIPYVWGGTTPDGFDCSGLVQYVFKKALGVDTGRVTTQQEHRGIEVPLSALRTGDLLFWGARGSSHHVAIYIGSGEFIQAPETGDVVKISKLEDFMPDFARRII